MPERSVKSWAGVALRVLVAVVGLSIVGWMMDWHDSVEIQAGSDQSQTYHLIEKQNSTAIIERDGERAEVSLDRDDVMLRPGLLTMLRQADWWWLLAGLVVTAGCLPLQCERWRRLLICRGVPVTWKNAFRLTMIGHFFNTFTIGSTGGDLVKGYYAVKDTKSRSTVIISVLMDRALAMLSLMLMGAIAGLFLLDEQATRRTTLITWAMLVGSAVAATLYFHPKTRRWLRIESLLDRLPGKAESMAHKADEAMVGYREHPGALTAGLGLALAAHACQVLGAVFTGWALGMPTSLWQMVVILPLIMLLGGLPISFMGFGVMEPVGLALLQPTGASANEVVSMLVLIRVYLILLSLSGAWWLVRGKVALRKNADISKPTPTMPRTS